METINKKIFDYDNNFYEILKRRYVEWNTLFGNKLFERNRFLSDYISGYSNISLTNTNDELRSPYTLSKVRDVVYGIYGQQRLGYETDNEEALNSFGINLNKVGERFDEYFSYATKNKPTFSFAAFTNDPATQMYSRGLNFATHRMLNKGDFFTKANLILWWKTILTGTHYLRLNYDCRMVLKEGIPKALENYAFSPVAPELIIDDGRYTTDTCFDLEESKFVMQIHRVDKETAKQMMVRYSKKAEKQVEDTIFVGWSGNYGEYDYMDMNALNNITGDERYKNVILIEVFWKKYPEGANLFNEFDWMQTWMIKNGSELDEIITLKNPYACGLPIIRKKFKVNPDSIFGNSIFPDLISLDAAKNAIYNALFNKANKNSKEKVIMSHLLANAKDQEGRYWNDWLDQRFNVRLEIGASVKNHVQKLEAIPIDTQALQLIEAIDAKADNLYRGEETNRSRMSYSSILKDEELKNSKYSAMMISDGVFQATLAKKLNQIAIAMPTEIDDVLKKQNKSIAYARDVLHYNPKDLSPDLIESGIVVRNTTEDNAVYNNSLEYFMQIIPSVGLEALQDEGIVSLLKLREAGYELPGDKERQGVYEEIARIIKKEIKMEDLGSVIFPLTINNEEAETPEDMRGQTTNVDYIIQNHEVAVEVTTKYIRENKHFVTDQEKEITDVLMEYLKRHYEAMMKNQAKQEAQQMFAAQNQAPQNQA